MRMDEDEMVRDEREEERRRMELIEGEGEVGWDRRRGRKREKKGGIDRKIESRDERMIEENEEKKKEEEEKEREDGKREDEKRRSRRGFSGRV